MSPHVAGSGVGRTDRGAELDREEVDRSRIGDVVPAVVVEGPQRELVAGRTGELDEHVVALARRDEQRRRSRTASSTSPPSQPITRNVWPGSSRLK